MLSTLHTSARAAVLAAVVGGFALAAPSTARGQSITAERALVNRLDAAPRGTVTAVTQIQAAPAPTPAPAPIEPGSFDRERALLNRSRAADGQVIRQPQAAQPGLATAPYADGFKALLNRSSL